MAFSGHIPEHLHFGLHPHRPFDLPLHHQCYPRCSVHLVIHVDSAAGKRKNTAAVRQSAKKA
ncbi:hypothetical protein FH972_021004 [Carpinus fangiana]|uniref:Uncharacterized protein n=1 Tax=Carpinus fangiana TaxID=176857 RepID=A0A5N6KNA5_9ROSI|nr:hypothetical protein FH972_021004 [Carpinus fangiana]